MYSPLIYLLDFRWQAAVSSFTRRLQLNWIRNKWWGGTVNLTSQLKKTDVSLNDHKQLTALSHCTAGTDWEDVPLATQLIWPSDNDYYSVNKNARKSSLIVVFLIFVPHSYHYLYRRDVNKMFSNSWRWLFWPVISDLQIIQSLTCSTYMELYEDELVYFSKEYTVEEWYIIKENIWN